MFQKAFAHTCFPIFMRIRVSFLEHENAHSKQLEFRYTGVTVSFETKSNDTSTSVPAPPRDSRPFAWSLTMSKNLPGFWQKFEKRSWACLVGIRHKAACLPHDTHKINWSRIISFQLQDSEMLPSERSFKKTWRPMDHPLFLANICAVGTFEKRLPQATAQCELRIFSAGLKQPHHGSSHGTTSPDNQRKCGEQVALVVKEQNHGCFSALKKTSRSQRLLVNAMKIYPINSSGL